MILAIIAVVFGVGAFVFAGLGANAKSKARDLIFTILTCVCILAFVVTIGFIDTKQDTAEAAKIEASEGEQKLEIVPADTSANITITMESLANEQLIKAFIDKWDGVLPDTINITIGDKND
jgi:hypothetical protein